MEPTRKDSKKHGGFVRGAVVFAIVIVLNLLFNYAISLFYKAPTYDAYLGQGQVIEPITNESDCIAVGGQWTVNTDMPEVSQPAPATDPTLAVPASGTCDPNYTKEQQFEAAQKTYDRAVFITLVVLGVVSIVLGLLLANAVLTLAFTWGGVLSLIIASVRYWSDANNILKVAILAAALAALIVVAVKKLAPTDRDETPARQ